MPVCQGNPFRGTGLMQHLARLAPDAPDVEALLRHCPSHAPTPLISCPELARHCRVQTIHIKDERARMGLGSFKALGAAYVIARDAVAARPDRTDLGSALAGRTYVAASAGNHGLSVAAGAAVFGAGAVIYLSQTVPDAFASRLRRKGARVVRAGQTYEESMAAACSAAGRNGWILLSDSTWQGYIDPAVAVMEGYLQLAREAGSRIPDAPTHVVLQAGVGGLAAAVAAHARARWGDDPIIVVVEPAAAPALFESIAAGQPVTAPGPVSTMGRLDCKTPSLVALASLSRDADLFVTITDAEAASGVAMLASLGLETTPSGGAGLAALMAGIPGVDRESRVLAILSEGTGDG